MTLIKSGLSELVPAIAELGGERVLILTGQSGRFAERVEGLLDAHFREVWRGAVRHVPKEAVDAASATFEKLGTDTVVALGGGSAIGLAKALRLRHSFRFIAIPTTHSGSERTNLYGITTRVEGTPQKQTARDDRVRPDVVIYDVELLRSMPRGLTVTSLMNAAAHALAALARPDADAPAVERAVACFAVLFSALESLVRVPTDRAARSRAAPAAGDAAQLLEAQVVGRHHRLVHQLGGAYDTEHAALHAVLLPYSVHELRRERPERLQALEEALSVFDLEAHLFDFSRRAGNPTSLRELGVPPDALERLPAELALPPESAWWLSRHGRRPSASVRHLRPGTALPVAVFGSLERARTVVVALHDAASPAEAVLEALQHILAGLPELCIVAPAAPGGQWLGTASEGAASGLEVSLEASLEEVTVVLDWVDGATHAERRFLFGMGQGASVALAALVRRPRALAGVIGLSGVRVALGTRPPAQTPRCPVLLGAAQEDPAVRPADVEATRDELEAAGHPTWVDIVPGQPRGLNRRHQLMTREMVAGRAPETRSGFGGFFESEALPRALPRDQNSPRRAPYGAYPEQLNGTAFGVPRRANLRTWMYRIRPSAQQSPFRALAHETFNTDFTTQAPEANLCGWGPLPWPTVPTDFVDGIITLGGGGELSTRRGYAVHWFAANRSMEERAFCNADGDLLLVPQSGQLLLLTELGILEVAAGQIAILPRGLRFSVVLRSARARGFLGEIYGRHFELAERGVIGANGLADARHFSVPTAWFEDRLAVGTQLVSKLGGRLYEARQDHSPYDVIAWHGNYVPSVYDLTSFAPVSNVRIDHADPSIYTVLSCPLDESGSNLLDLVVFPPRWDPTEHTFRPPFFHRNATMEWNAVIRSQALEGFQFAAGTCFLTPPMTPHGVTSHGVERALASESDAPHRHGDDSLWIQFESALPMQLSPVAQRLGCRIEDWPTRWGAYRNHFRPSPD